MAEQVDHPAHYQTESGLEAIDVIEAFGLGFRLGNAVKYLLRAGKKGDALTDLRKARWYLDREIEKLEPPQVLYPIAPLPPFPPTPGGVARAAKRQTEGGS